MLLHAFPGLSVRPDLGRLSYSHNARCTMHIPHRVVPLYLQKDASLVSSSRCWNVRCAGQVDTSQASTSQSMAAKPVKTADGSLNDFPQSAGVYSIYSSDGKLQYIGLSRKVPLQACM